MRGNRFLTCLSPHCWVYPNTSSPHPHFTVTIRSSVHGESAQCADALTMRLKEKLAARLGREPTGLELTAARERKRAKKAEDAQRSQPPLEKAVMNLVVIVATKDADGNAKYEKLGGPTSEDELVIKHRNGDVETTLKDVRSSASSLFPHGSGHGWQVFTGADLRQPRFIPDESKWHERFELLHTASKIAATSIFVREVMSLQMEGTLVDVRPASATAADLTLQSSPIELQAAAEATAKFAAHAPNNSARKTSKTAKKAVMPKQPVDPEEDLLQVKLCTWV